MKDKLYKRAKAFMCVMIIVSVVFGGVRSLTAKQNDALEEYYSAEGQSAGLAADKITSNARNLQSVAGRYIEGEKEYKALAKANEDFLESDGIREESECIYALMDKAKAVYERLSECELSAQDETYRKELYYNIKSYYSVLAHAEYNGTAAEFNKLIKKLPANAFAAISGIQELPVFEVE